MSEIETQENGLSVEDMEAIDIPKTIDTGLVMLLCVLIIILGLCFFWAFITFGDQIVAPELVKWVRSHQ